MPNPVQHRWSEADDTVAFYLARWQGVRFLGMGEATIARVLSGRAHEDGSMSPPMPEISLLRRIQNFDYLAGKPRGLSNYAPQSERIFTKYKATPLPQLRPLALEILDLTPSEKVEREYREFCLRFLGKSGG